MTSYLVWPSGELQEIEISATDPITSLQRAIGADTVALVPLNRPIGKLTLENDEGQIEVQDPVVWCDEDGLPKQLFPNTFISYITGRQIVGPVVVMPRSEMPQ